MVKLAVVFTILLSLVLTSCAKENSIDGESVTANETQSAETLRIAAAANLADVLPDIIAGYQADNRMTKQKIDVTYASSGKLYAQITAGAPYDIFLSADQAFPAKLVDADGIANPNATPKKSQNESIYKPFTYARGQLALYSVSQPFNDNKGNASAVLTDLFTTNPNSKITIANPELAPYGASAKAYLQTQKVYDSLNKQKRLIQAENISQAFQYAHTGSVEYGFVAQSQVVAIEAVATRFVTLPPDTYPAILQDGIVISNAPVAVDFSQYLRSSAGQAYFAAAGYLAVQ